MTELTAEQIVSVEPGEAPVHGFLHHAENSSDFLVLTHGAGGNCKAPLLVALATRFAAAGINTLRCDLPFRQRRPTGPPSPSDAKHDQDGLRHALRLMAARFEGRAYLGGSSYGGRQASILVSNDPALVQGLLLLSYPLHPPGRPTQLRTAHFAAIQVPCLFISGTKDAFGSIAELEAALPLIPADTKLVAMPGAGHGLLQKANRNQVTDAVVEEFGRFFGVASGSR